ncbi:MAG: DUF4203 domain-containing protein [Thermoanaerobaculia bacterium]|nr:DUF4203 domain-containing protein [Thermoanaerobaculia bacterium]
MENVLQQVSASDAGLAAAGLVLLFFGRKLFWLALAGLGFLLGLAIADQLLPAQSEGVRLGLALLCGVAGGFLAVLAQKLAIRLAGILGGGFAGFWLIGLWPPHDEPRMLVAVVVGAIVGALLAGLLFETALIIVSALAGASLFAQSSHLPDRFAPWAFLVLLCLGVIVQARGAAGHKAARNAP